MSVKIEDKAIFIADSHFNKKNQELLYLLNKIEKQKLNISQLFLMGDIFDFLSCESNYFIKQNIEVINILNRLSNNLQIVYLEGNHDFNLQKIFPNIKVIKREFQPFFIKIEEKTVALAHGDNFINSKYELFCKVIRNHFLLCFLNFIDIKFFISKKIEESLLKKYLCHKIYEFEDLVKERLKNYKCDIVLEGHFHQGKTYIIDNKEYINIPSLCCQKEYLRFRNGKFLVEDLRRKK